MAPEMAKKSIEFFWLGLIFLILGLWIFFQNIKVGGGKKIKIKITKKIFFLFILKHEPSSLFHHSVLVDLNVSMMMH